MKIVFSVIVFLHGLLHLLGFVKGFGFNEVKQLILPINKSMAVLWLTTAIIILIYGISFIMNSKYNWLVGFIVVVLSQILIILFWSDAKFGTLPNIIILVASIISFGDYNFQKLIQLEKNHILSHNNISSDKVISENDIIDLPGPVQKWLSHSGVIGKPYISMGKVTQLAKIKMKPDQKDWMTATALQYTTVDSPAFIWTIDGKMNNLLTFQGRDKFENGKGEMLIKINSIFNVVNEKGDKLNEGTIQRYLGEMVWFPSLAISPYITWEKIDATSAKATINYKGTKGSGIFYFNSEGDFTKFSSFRYKDNNADAKRYEWVLSVNDYKIFEGIKIPAKMTATWKLDEGDWTWLILEITDLKHNESASR